LGLRLEESRLCCTLGRRGEGERCTIAINTVHEFRSVRHMEGTEGSLYLATNWTQTRTLTTYTDKTDQKIPNTRTKAEYKLDSLLDSNPDSRHVHEQNWTYAATRRK
jgi:hypothetical protein